MPITVAKGSGWLRGTLLPWNILPMSLNGSTGPTMVFSSKTICRYMPQLTSPVSGSAATIMCQVHRYRPPSPSWTMGAGRSKRLASSPRRTTSLHGASLRSTTRGAIGVPSVRSRYTAAMSGMRLSAGIPNATASLRYVAKGAPRASKPS